MNATDPKLQQAVTVCAVIKVALFLGVITFVGVSVFVADKPDEANPGLQIAIGGLTAAAVVARLVVPRVFVSKARSSIVRGEWKNPAAPQSSSSMPDDHKLAMVYQTQMIVGSALLEGAAFANVAAYIMEGHPGWLVAAGVLAFAILIDFPTTASVSRWLDRQRQLLHEEKMLAGPRRAFEEQAK